METLSLPVVLGLLAIGFLTGVIFDRLVLWPLAQLLARLDGRDDPR